jgi:hypothetical protein
MTLAPVQDTANARPTRGRGGHFAAWEQPQLFSEEIRAACRSLRSSWPAALIRDGLPLRLC